jgi:3-hydroxyisobutyrate dehydrogenase-like beta-hydroxyacid dehydrogenase
MEKVGIIGLGRVGMPSARRFIKMGYQVVGFERRKEVMEEAKSICVETARNCKEVAQKAKTVIILVLNDQQVIEVVTGPNGILAGCDSHSQIICMSTINRDNLEWIAKKCREENVGFIDCPFTGGPARAEKGTLTLIAAAPRGLLEACRRVLEVLGQIVHAGETPGMGQSVKHCNQLLVGTTHAAVMETLAMAKKSGLDPRLVCKVIGKGIAGSDYFRLLSSSVLDNTPSPGGLGQMCKDMDIVINTGRRLKLPLFVATSAYQYFLAAQSLGMEDQEGSQLIRVVERISELGGLKSGATKEDLRWED